MSSKDCHIYYFIHLLFEIHTYIHIYKDYEHRKDWLSLCHCCLKVCLLPTVCTPAHVDLRHWQLTATLEPCADKGPKITDTPLMRADEKELDYKYSIFTGSFQALCARVGALWAAVALHPQRKIPEQTDPCILSSTNAKPNMLSSQLLDGKHACGQAEGENGENVWPCGNLGPRGRPPLAVVDSSNTPTLCSPRLPDHSL